MGKKYIEINLLPDGSIKAETHGVKGKACLTYMEMITAMISGQITDSSFTEEFYETEVHNSEEIVGELEVNA